MTENTFIYPANRTTHGCTTLLLIDQAVRNAQVFVSSANATTYPLIYSPQSSKPELRTFLQNNFPIIDRIGLVFETSGGSFRPFFLDRQPFFNQADITYFAENIQTAYSENVTFLINLLKDFRVANIDYLACNTLNYPDWAKYYAILSQETNNSVVIGASNDETGNIKYGGDWVMESTSQNIELIYFTKSIEYYTYLLDASFLTAKRAFHLIALKNDGTIWGVGWNVQGELGIGNYTRQTILNQMDTTMIEGRTPKSICCLLLSTLVLMTDGSLWGTGTNNGGRLGLIDDIDITNTLYPVDTTMIEGRTPKSIFGVSTSTIVLMSDGTIWGTGQNSGGQLGIAVGDTTGRFVLTQMDTTVIGGRTPQFIQCNFDSTIVLMTDGTIWGTGRNSAGELGIAVEDRTQRNVLTQMNTTMIVSEGKTPQYISGTLYTTIVLMTDGTIWGTGDNSSGQLGIGNITSQTVLTQMNTTMLQNLGKTPKSISGNNSSTIVLMTDGTIWGTGLNNYGQLGLGNTDSQTVLTQMNTTVIGGRTPQSIYCNSEATYALMDDGTIWSTGRNSVGELGIAVGDRTQRNVLTQMGPNNNNFVDLPDEDSVPPAPSPAPAPAPRPAQIYSMRGIYANNSQVYYKPHSLSTGSGGSGVGNSRHKQRRT